MRICRKVAPNPIPTAQRIGQAKVTTTQGGHCGYKRRSATISDLESESKP